MTEDIPEEIRTNKFKEEDRHCKVCGEKVRFHGKTPVSRDHNYRECHPRSCPWM